MSETTISPADSVNFGVANGHLGFLLPPNGNYAGAWERWTGIASEVQELYWRSRQEVLECDNGETQAVTLSTCDICGGKCKFAQPLCGGAADAEQGEPTLLTE